MLVSHYTIGMDRSHPTGSVRIVGTDRFGALHRLTLLALFLLLLPTGAVGQPTSAEALVKQGEKAGADAELMRSVVSRTEQAGIGAAHTAELLRPVVDLAENNLQTRPLLTKTLEGLAKRVPPARMTPVLQQIQTHTERAGALVSTWLDQERVQSLIGESGAPSAADRDQLITNVTQAQQQDVPLADVEQFLNALPGDGNRRSVPLSAVSAAVGVMPDLPGSASNPQVTQELLTAALDAGYDGESLRQLPAALESAQRRTQRPSSTVARGVVQAIANGTPAASVLRSLFQGSVPGAGTPVGPADGPPGQLPGQGKAPPNPGGPDDQGPPDDPGRGNPPQ